MLSSSLMGQETVDAARPAGQVAVKKGKNQEQMVLTYRHK